MTRRVIRIVASLLVCGVAASCGSSGFKVPLTGAPGKPIVVPVTGSITPVHDPSIAYDNGTFHLFATGTWIDHRTSKDLVHWKSVGSVFPKLPSWVNKTIGYSPTSLWAPDISYWGGTWHLYYAASEWHPGKVPTRNSAIAFATSPTLDIDDPRYRWVDHGPILRSKGPYLEDRSGFNAIDPNVVLDGHGRPWLAWGSGFEGIFIQPLRPNGTLDPSAKPIDLARRANNPALVIEGATIVRHGKWWYLFASFDLCCGGVHSTYNVRVGRSRALTGPYFDRSGRPMLKGGGTKILSAYDNVRGPGHEAVFEHGGKWFLVHHYYDANNKGIPTLGIRPLDWSADGWPTARGWSKAIAIPGAPSGQP